MNPKIVAVAFLDEVPDGVAEAPASDRHCAFIGKALQGETFCVRPDSIECPMGRYYLGVDGLDPVVDAVIGWKLAADKQRAAAFVEGCSPGPRPFRYAAYGPYPGCGFEPDMLIAVCTPGRAQRILRAHTAAGGQRVRPPLAGVGAACGECVGHVMATGEPVVSLACDGSRPRIGMADTELLVACPFDSPMRDLLTAEE